MSTMNCFKNRYCWLALATVVAVVCWPVWAQSQTVTVRASVSEVVALSASPNLAPNVRVDAAGDCKSLTLELTGTGEGVQTFRLPILIRSNSGYSISSLVRSESVSSVKLQRLEARSTGQFVAKDAATGVFATNPLEYVRLETPTPFVRGSRVSLAGTLDSTGNALELTLLVAVFPETKSNDWRLQLTLSATPER